MPAFIFIMGFFSKNYDKCRNEAFDKFLIPYIVLVVLSFIQAKYFIKEEDTLLVFRVFSPMGSCWFLLVSYIWKLLVKDLVRIRFILPITALAGILIGFSHEFGYKMALGRLVAFSFFFLCGVLATRETIEKIRKINKVMIIALLLLVVTAIWYLSYIEQIPIESVLVRTYYRDDNQLWDMIYRVCYYVIALLMIIILINLTPNKKFKFTYIGSRTLIIYYFHMFIVRFIDKYFNNVTIWKREPYIYLISAVIIAIVITFILSRKVFEAIYNKIFEGISFLMYKKTKNNIAGDEPKL